MSGGFCMRFYSRLFIVLLLTLLSACNTPAPQPTATPRGPIVPTRGVPPTAIELAVGSGTEIAGLLTPTDAATDAATPEQTFTEAATTEEATTDVNNLGAPTEEPEAADTAEPTATDEPTATESASPTNSPTPTTTNTPTDTASPTVTETATNTATATETATIEPSPSATPTNSPTPTPTVSTGPIPISYEDSVQGVITNEAPELMYTFEGQTGDVVTISMARTSGDLDTYLLLMAPNGEKITENDDIVSGNTDSLIEAFTLPDDGTYTIVVTRYQRRTGTSTGEFTLTLGTGAPDDRPIVILDEPVEGSIDDETFAIAYRFDGQENQVIDIAVRGSGDLNPQVLLLPPDGREYARNDDESNRETDSLIDGVRLPATGSYTIIVTRYQQEFGRTEGDYELEVTESDPADSPFTVLARNLDYGSTEEGSLGDNLPYHQIFTFAGRAGDVVTVEMSRPQNQVDTLVILTDAQGHEILRNDDDLTRNNTTNSIIPDAILPADGFYTIIASRYDEALGNSAGDFEISLILEESADENETRAVYAPLDVRNSGAVRTDNTYFETPFYVAGDFLNDSEDEVAMQALLTFVLPPLPENATLDFAELDLSRCREVGEGFSGFDDLSIYVDTYRELSNTEAEPSSRADEIETIGDCETVDISDAVTSAYEDGDSILQIRLGFADGINRNDEADYVLFDPRLTLVLNN